MTIDVPAGTELVSASIGFLSVPCSVTGTTATCTLPTIADRTFVTTVVDGTEVGTGEVTATATAAATDPDPSNNTSTTSLTVVAEPVPADLAVSTAADLGDLVAGETLSYLVSVANQSDQGATDVVLTDELPEGVEVVSAAAGWLARPCAVEARTVTCDLGTVTGETFVRVTVEGVTPADGLIHFATVTASTPDPNSADDSATGTLDVVEVRSVADLRLWGPTSPLTTRVGDTVDVAVVVTDLAGTRPTGVSVLGEVPAGLEVVSVTRAGSSHRAVTPTRWPATSATSARASW